MIFDVKKYIVNSSDEFRNKSKKIAKNGFIIKKYSNRSDVFEAFVKISDELRR